MNTERPKPYPTLSLPELLDGPTDIDWVLEPFLPPSASVLLAGSSGVGKTWLALDLALSIAIGKPWLGQYPVHRGPVLMVDEESSELLLRVRMAKLLAGHGIDGSGLPLHFLVGNAVDLTPARMPKTGQTVASLGFRRLLETALILRPALVVIDSLTRVHRSNENASGEMSGLFAQIKRLTTATGAVALLVHHFRKTGRGGGASGDRIRGSSDIRAFCDTTLLVDEAEGGAVITHDKSRWSEPIEPFSVQFAGEGDAFKLEYGGEPSGDSKGTDKFREAWSAILDTFKVSGDGPLNRQDLIQAVVKEQQVCSIRTLDQVLAWRCDKEFLSRSRAGRKVTFNLTDGGQGPGVIEVEGKPFTPSMWSS